MADSSRIKHKTSIFRQVCGALAVNVLSLCNGLSACWTSPVELILEKRNNPIRAEPITKEEFSWAGAALYLGGFVGIFIWNYVADKFGRKVNGYMLAFTQIVSWLGITAASSLTHLNVSRFVMGLGGAGIITGSQLYINETAQSNIKGPLCSLLIIAMQLGYLYVFILGALLPYHIFNYACLMVPIVFVLLFYWLPESPLYLLMKQKPAAAKEALLWFNYGNEEAAEEKLKALSQSIDENVKPAPLKELLASRESIQASFVTIVFLAGQQLCGYSFISSYTVKIFSLSHTNDNPYHRSILVCLIQFITSCAIAYAAKYAPKRTMMLISYFVACLSLASLSFYFYWQESHDMSHFTWVPTASLIVYIMCYSSGIGPVSYMLISEIVPARFLNNVISVALTISILLACGSVKIFPWLLHHFQPYGTFLLYSLNNAALTLFVLKFVSQGKFDRTSQLSA